MNTIPAEVFGRRVVQISLIVIGAVVVANCGGDGGGSSVDPNASKLVITPASLTLHPFDQKTPQVSRPDGTPVTGAQWVVSDLHVATIVSGVVTGYAEGTATLTATSGSRTGTMTVIVPADLSVGDFTSPLGADASALNVFDHDLPHELDARFNNGYDLSYWGERMGGIDGHNGYDWVARQGTPVLAAGPGRVISAGSEQPFTCSLLNNAVVSGLWVMITHAVKPAELIATQYGHLSRIDVKVGDSVTAGQPIGLSGSTGCSTTPHLHFSAYRERAGTSDGVLRVMDPYGWRSGNDPWAADTGGVASLAIWSVAKAPLLYGELNLNGNLFVLGSRVVMPKTRYWGVDDAANVNNEFVDLIADPNLGSVDVSGWTLSSSVVDATFTFPSGTRVQSATPLRLYSGTGTNSATTIYWGRTTGAWNNRNDCPVLYDANHTVVFNVFWGGGPCTAGVTQAGIDRSAIDAGPNSGARVVRAPAPPR